MALTLLYFDIHGLGARIRIAARHGAVPLIDRRFADRAEFLAMQQAHALPFGQVPLLLVDGQAPLSQSSAILRYICTLGGLHPADALAAARVDAALQAESDAFAAYGVVKYRARNGLDGLDAASLASAEAAVARDVVPRHLGHLERALLASATGWVAGTAGPAACDFAWGTQLRDLRKGALAFVPATVLEALPAVNAFLDRFLALESVAAYYADFP